MRRGRGAGANFGWRPFEGRSRFTPGESADGHVPPVITRTHGDGWCSITGGVVVRDRSLSGLRGRYLFGDICKSRIYSAKLSAGRATGVRATSMRIDDGLLVRRGRPRARLRRVAQRAGLPARTAMSVDELEGLDVVRVRAENPGPYTLSGTNTWVVGRDPAWVVDPGPEIGEHLDNVAADGRGARRRGRDRGHPRPRRPRRGPARAA